MNVIAILIVAALVLGICWLVDRAFQKLFRSKAQHRSGKAVRASKRYGVIGVILMVLGIAGIVNGGGLLIMGSIVALLGAAMCVYYLSFGIFYDDESILVSGLFKKSKTYSYDQIQAQQLYLVTGGNVIVELHMENGETVSVQSMMDGAYPFLDHAFSRWCAQKGLEPEGCTFHDPGKCCWFPPVGEEA